MRLGQYLTERKDFVADQITERTPSWMPKFIDKFLAERLTDGVANAVNEMQDPDHPWRHELGVMVHRWIEKLASDPETMEQAEQWKMSLLDNPDVQQQVSNLWDDFEKRLAADPQMQARTVTQALERGLTALGRWLSEDDEARDRLNGWIRIGVRRTVAPRRQEIGDFVAGVVRGWDTQDVVEKLELQVGRDLQYIRINGTVVGGFVGLLIYSVSQVAF
jgi:uncharacterized membrane-anchored protein YjiN (DUF445 family)